MEAKDVVAKMFEEINTVEKDLPNPFKLEDLQTFRDLPADEHPEVAKLFRESVDTGNFSNVRWERRDETGKNWFTIVT